MVSKERLALTRAERAALDDLVARLRATYGDAITAVILFGSKARGDADEQADLDVLILIKDAYLHQRQSILRLGARVSFEYDLLLNLLVLTGSQWQTRQGFTLHRNIIRDGVMIFQQSIPPFAQRV